MVFPGRIRLSVYFLILFSSCSSYVSAFTFRFTSPPTQCHSTTMVWEGGTPPYKIMLLPVGFMPQGEETRVIFDRTIQSGNSLTFTFPFPANSRFAAIMSDSQGFGTGGTSKIITVSSSSDTSCLPRTHSTPQFFLYLSSPTFTQCGSLTIGWDSPRSPPATVYGVIPGGQSFDLNAPSRTHGGTSFDWTVNVREGTPLMFVAGDGNGAGTGGSSDLTYVLGGASSCISANSPSSTPDDGTGGYGPLPNQGHTTTATATAIGGTQTGGTQTGGTQTSGFGNNDGNGSGTLTSGASTFDDGSGGGTVTGPLGSPTSSNLANSNNSKSRLPLILGIILGVITFGVLIAGGVFCWKKRKEERIPKGQKSRLLGPHDVSEVDLPHRPMAGQVTGFQPWGSNSLESLSSAFRTTPFGWASGSGAARPPIGPASSSSSALLRRIRSQAAAAGMFSGGYESLEEPVPFPIENTSGSGSGADGTTPSSSNPSHKSPLPQSYVQTNSDSLLQPSSHPQGPRPLLPPRGQTNTSWKSLYDIPPTYSSLPRQRDE